MGGGGGRRRWEEGERRGRGGIGRIKVEAVQMPLTNSQSIQIQPLDGWQNMKNTAVQANNESNKNNN